MEFTYKTKQLVAISKEVGNYYTLEKGAYEDNIEVLAKLISILGGVSEEQAYEEIDSRMEEGKKIKDLYSEIFEGINSKGFFTNQLEADIQIVPVDISGMTEKLYEKYVGLEVEQAIKDSKSM